MTEKINVQKRKISISFGAIAASALIPGISISNVSAQTNPSGSLTVWVGSWWAPQIPVASKLWNAQYPNVKLNIEALPINGYLDKYIATALGGSPPDIVDVDSTWVSTVASKGLFQKLDDLEKELDIADIDKAMLSASRFKNSLYAVPNRGGPEVYYYNKTVFDKAKVAYPQANWTHDDVVRIAKALTIKGDQYGMGVPADASDPSNVLSLFCPILWHHGGEFLNKDNTAPAINSPEAVKAITYWSNFYLKDGSAPQGTPNFSTTRDLFPLFTANKLGLISSSSNTFDALLNTPNVKWGAVLSPDKVNRAGGWTMGIPVGAKNTANAKLFLKWLSKPEIQAVVMNRYPSSLKARKLAPWNDPKWDIFTTAAPFSRSVPVVAGWFEMQTAIIAALQKVLVKQATPQQAADEAAAKIKIIIAENK